MKAVYSIVFCLFLGACAGKQIYYWRNYEPIVYSSFSNPGKQSPEEQIELLLKDLDQTQQNKLKVHPGLYAQLGYLHAQRGDVQNAQKYFDLERNAFPESEKLMQRFINGGKVKKQK